MEGIAFTGMIKTETAPTLSNTQHSDAEACSKDANEDAQLRRRIMERLKAMRDKPARALVDERITESGIYIKLKKKADAKDCIGNSEDCIDQLNELVENVSPDFRRHLDILTDWQVSSKERTVALLMKCGFTNAQCASLLARSTSTVSTQRSAIARKAGVPIGSIDMVIAML